MPQRTLLSLTKRQANERSNLDLPFCLFVLQPLYRYSDLVTRLVHEGILCCWKRRSPSREWHGNRRGLDVGRLFHLDGGAYLISRSRRHFLPDGLDRRLRSARPFASTLPAEIRQIHRARFYRRPLLFAVSATDCRVLCDRYFLRVCLWADAGGRHRVFALS